MKNAGIPQKLPSERYAGGYFPDSTWELFQRIEHVAVIYGDRRPLDLAEFNSAPRLLKLLWTLGRNRIRVRGVICPQGSLSPLHLAALNCYLQHHFAAQTIKQLRNARLHRFTWYDLQAEVGLVWS